LSAAFRVSWLRDGQPPIGPLPYLMPLPPKPSGIGQRPMPDTLARGLPRRGLVNEDPPSMEQATNPTVPGRRLRHVLDHRDNAMDFPPDRFIEF
jgi:hypothetical protein